MKRFGLWLVISGIFLFLAAFSLYADKPGSGIKKKHALIYTKNGKGYVHKNIPASIKALKEICNEMNIVADATEDPAAFTPENLKKYDVLIFSNTNNEVFDNETQKKALQNYIRHGGGFVGIHSANATERNWPWMWAMVGGKFVRHDHHGNWLDCIKTRKQPISPIEEGHRACTVCLISHIAMKLPGVHHWDPLHERFINDDAANSRLSRPQRYPYGTNYIKV